MTLGWCEGIARGQFHRKCLKLAATSEALSETDILRFKK